MSDLSDFLNIPLPGLTKTDDNTLQLLRPLAEIQAVASDATVTGINAAALRLRNVYQAIGAGPNIYMEGTNSVAAVKTLVRMQSKFLNFTTAIEESALVLSVLKGGTAASIELRGDATANLSPAAVGGFGLGTQSLPWLESWVGNTGGTRYLKTTSTGPGTDNALVTEGGALVIYNAAQATLTIAATGLTVGALTLAGATSGVGIQTTLTASGGHTGDITGHALTTTAQAGSGTVTGYRFTYSGASDYGLRILASVAGDDLAYGVYIDTSAEITTAAYFQQQRAAATGSFLVLQNSAGTALFTVNSSGNIVFGTTGQRITGDFSNATPANQVMFQSSTVNGATNVGTLPNGTGTSSGQVNYAGSDSANTNYLSLAATTTGININTGKNGTGTTQDITFQVDATRVMQIVAAQGDVVIGKTGLAAANTSGHIFIPAFAGVMTGVPTARAGFVPLYFDTTNNKLGVYDTAWIHSAALS